MSKWDAYSSDEEGESSQKPISRVSSKASKAEMKASSTHLSLDTESSPKKKARIDEESSILLVENDQLIEHQLLSEPSLEHGKEKLVVVDDNVASSKLNERPYNPIFDGCRSVECYQRLNFIDQGTYGMVFRAKCKVTNEVYALKQVKLGAETNKVGFPVTALREINILLALQHPYIVRVKEMVVGSSIDKVYMVMEYCENDLKTCMKLSKQSFSTAEVFPFIVV